jgi:hypothetical protein
MHTYFSIGRGVHKALEGLQSSSQVDAVPLAPLIIALQSTRDVPLVGTREEEEAVSAQLDSGGSAEGLYAEVKSRELSTVDIVRDRPCCELSIAGAKLHFLTLSGGRSVKFTVTRGDEKDGLGVENGVERGGVHAGRKVAVEDQTRNASCGVYMLTANARLPALPLPVDVTQVCLEPATFCEYLQTVLLPAVQGC